MTWDWASAGIGYIAGFMTFCAFWMAMNNAVEMDDDEVPYHRCTCGGRLVPLGSSAAPGTRASSDISEDAGKVLEGR